MMSEIACSRQLTRALRQIQYKLMISVSLPEKVVLRLVDSTGIPVRISNVLFRVHMFANRKNDFLLGPFATDADGVATITRAQLLAEAAAHYDSGLMDYDQIEECKPVVEIAPMEPSDIDRALKSRITLWKNLLQGETERWASIEELCNVYRNAANGRVSAGALRVCWDSSEIEVEYAVPTMLR
jgi:hypothetical protein